MEAHKEATKHDPDIGRCDYCGSEEGRRSRTVWQGVDAWFCDECRGTVK